MQRMRLRANAVISATLVALFSIAFPAKATLPSWQQVSEIDRIGLVAAARQHLPQQAAALMEQAIDKVTPQYKPRVHGNPHSSLMTMKNAGFIRDVVAISIGCLSRGERSSVQQFYSAVNQGRFIRGYGQYHLKRGGYGGPMIVELQIRPSKQGKLDLVVWYRLIEPGMADGKPQAGPEFIFPTGIDASK